MVERIFLFLNLTYLGKTPCTCKQMSFTTVCAISHFPLYSVRQQIARVSLDLIYDLMLLIFRECCRRRTTITGWEYSITRHTTAVFYHL